MQDAFIVSALRTPIGKKKGSLSAMHPADLGAIVLSETFNKIDLDPNVLKRLDENPGTIDAIKIFRHHYGDDAFDKLEDYFKAKSIIEIMAKDFKVLGEYKNSKDD